VALGARGKNLPTLDNAQFNDYVKQGPLTEFLKTF
jgi:hypothetical protein